MIMYKALKGGQVYDLVANDFLIELTATQYNKMRDDEYRALNYLKIFIKEESALLTALATPFQILAQSSSLQVEKTQLNLLLMPGGGAGEIKKWGIHNFIAAGNAVATQLNKTCHLHILLGPDETDEINIMTALMAESDNLSLHTNIPIKDIAQLASLCDLTIANDCGPSHIAQCLQKPYIGIYRELNPEWFLSHALSRKVVPQTGQDIKTINIESVTEHAIHLLENQP
ncbi:glycosyltransferase family 9 protein [Marinomonas spartinae]|nr:glycosyltransferase family 9 protein [Marinomonas spartinae]